MYLLLHYNTLVFIYYNVHYLVFRDYMSIFKTMLFPTDGKFNAAQTGFCHVCSLFT